MSSRAATFVDQGLSSATNFGCAGLAAGLLTRADFGAYALGFGFYLVVLGFARAFTSDALVVLYSSATPATGRGAVIRASTVSVGTGIAAAACATVTGLVLANETGHALVALAPCLPFLLLQDVWRYGYVMLGEPQKACLSDGCWLVIATAGLMLLRLTDTRSVPLAMLAWGCGAVPGALVGGVALLRKAAASDVLHWLREAGALSARYAADFLVVAVSGYLMVLCLVGISSLDDAAGIRGAQVLMGPPTVAFLGASMYFMPEMSRLRERGVEVVRKLAIVQSTALALFTAVWLVSVLSLPDSVGERVFGASWAGSQARLPLIGIAFVCNAAATGPVCGIRAMQWAKRGLHLRLAAAGAILTATAAGAFWSVPSGALVGFAFGSGVAAVTWWAGLRASTRNHTDNYANVSAR
jgi:hypothetical protein